MWYLLLLAVLPAQGVWYQSPRHETAASVWMPGMTKGVYVNSKSTILLRHNGSSKARVCTLASAADCTYDLPGTDECEVVTADCTCYRWEFSGSSNTSVAGGSIYSPMSRCADVSLRAEGTVVLEWSLVGKWPYLPPGYRARAIREYHYLADNRRLTEAQYMGLFTRRLCKRRHYSDLGVCKVQTTLRLKRSKYT